jgi:hypothetical protein
LAATFIEVGGPLVERDGFTSNPKASRVVTGGSSVDLRSWTCVYDGFFADRGGLARSVDGWQRTGGG